MSKRDGDKIIEWVQLDCGGCQCWLLRGGIIFRGNNAPTGPVMIVGQLRRNNYFVINNISLLCHWSTKSSSWALSPTAKVRGNLFLLFSTVCFQILDMFDIRIFNVFHCVIQILNMFHFKTFIVRLPGAIWLWGELRGSAENWELRIEKVGGSENWEGGWVRIENWGGQHLTMRRIENWGGGWVRIERVSRKLMRSLSQRPHRPLSNLDRAFS